MLPPWGLSVKEGLSNGFIFNDRFPDIISVLGSNVSQNKYLALWLSLPG